MANIYGILKKAQLESSASDLSGLLTGLIYWHSVEGRAKVCDGVNPVHLLANDQKCIFGTNGTASNNVRLNRGAASRIQLLKGDDTTAEGSMTSTPGNIAELSFACESHAGAPTAGKAGRIIWNSSNARLEVDRGSSWAGLGGLAAWATSSAYGVGDVVYFTDNLIYKCLSAHTSGTFLTDLNTGKWIKLSNDEINELKNKDLSAWSTYADAAGLIPVDGTGGSANVTWEADTSSPLGAEEKSFLFTKDAVNRQGQGASVNFSIESAGQGKIQTISFDYSIGSGTYADNDLIVYIYDVTNAVLIEPANIYIKNATVNVNHKATFQASINSTSYRLIFHVASTSASAYTVKFANIKVAAQDIVNGAYISDWVSYTPTGSWITNTTYAGKWRRVGDTMECIVNISVSGAPTSTSLTVSLPPGFSIDTAKLTDISNPDTTLGLAYIRDAGTTHLYGRVGYYNTTAVYAFSANSSTAYLERSLINATTPITFANGDYIIIKFAIPILGWGSNVSMSGVDAADGRVCAFRYDSTTTACASGSTTTVIFTSKKIDTHMGMNTSTGEYTIPVSGKWRFAGNVISNNNISPAAVTNYLGLIIYKNGSPMAHGYETVKITSAHIPKSFVQAILDCNAGDIITMRLYQNTGTSITPETNYFSFFEGERLSSASAISAGEKIYAEYNTAAGQNIPNAVTVVNFANKVADTHGAVTNPSTAFKFYAPVAKPYSIKGLLTFASGSYTSGNRIFVNLYKNGSSEGLIGYYIAEATIAQLACVAFQKEINLLAGDYIEIRAQNEADENLQSSTAKNTWISIVGL